MNRLFLILLLSAPINLFCAAAAKAVTVQTEEEFQKSLEEVRAGLETLSDVEDPSGDRRFAQAIVHQYLDELQASQDPNREKMAADIGFLRRESSDSSKNQDTLLKVEQVRRHIQAFHAVMKAEGVSLDSLAQELRKESLLKSTPPTEEEIEFYEDMKKNLEYGVLLASIAALQAGSVTGEEAYEKHISRHFKIVHQLHLAKGPHRNPAAKIALFTLENGIILQMPTHPEYKKSQKAVAKMAEICKMPADKKYVKALEFIQQTRMKPFIAPLD